MNISGATVILVNGKPTRVLGSRFNQKLRAYHRGLDSDKPLMCELGGVLSPSTTRRFMVQTLDGHSILPSKNLTWVEVANQVRAGKKVVAKVT